MAVGNKNNLLSGDFPLIPLRDSAFIHIAVGREIEVEGCRSILAYCQTALTLRIGTGLVTFEGADIVISSLTEYHITFSGEITSVSFGKRA